MSYTKTCTKLINRYGTISQLIKKIEKIRAKLRDKILDLGMEEMKTDQFTIKCTQVSQSFIDYNGLLEELNPSQNIIQRHTHQRVSTRITVESTRGIDEEFMAKLVDQIV